MSLELVTLRHVSVRHVHGDRFTSEEIGEESAFKARFGLTIEIEENQEDDEFRFQIGQNFEAVIPSTNEPFFKIEIAGHFSSADKKTVGAWINTREGAYDLGATLFPYLRSLAKPLLEGLGAAQIEFPWSTPQIEKVSEITQQRKTNIKKKPVKPKES